jgi:hypothetical protein
MKLTKIDELISSTTTREKYDNLLHTVTGALQKAEHVFPDSPANPLSLLELVKQDIYCKKSLVETLDQTLDFGHVL